MELIEGYKLTEVGVIPEDWEMKTLKDISWVNQGLQIPISKRLKLANKRSKQYITIQFLNNSKEVEYIDDYTPSVCCSIEDVLMTRTGNTGIVIHDVEGVFHNNFFKINFDKKQVDRNYLIYFLKDKKTQKTILEKAGTSTIPDLNHNDFYSIFIPLPSLKEQSIIANTLFDADTLIISLEKLITKKRSIKRGAMQNLLTGKKRLPGFNLEWRVLKLSDIGEFKNGINKGNNDFGFGYPFINLMDVFGVPSIKSKSDLGLVNSTELEKRKYNLKKGDVLFVRSSVKPDGVGLTSLIEDDLKDTVYSGFLIRFRDYGILEHSYKRHCFYEENFRKNLIESSTISANTNINQEALKSLEIKIPSDKREQMAIAQVLDEMDSEILVLEEKMKKCVKIKQGMMQNLLNGRIRLIKKEEPNAVLA